MRRALWAALLTLGLVALGLGAAQRPRTLEARADAEEVWQGLDYVDSVRSVTVSSALHLTQYEVLGTTHGGPSRLYVQYDPKNERERVMAEQCLRFAREARADDGLRLGYACEPRTPDAECFLSVGHQLRCALQPSTAIAGR